VEYRKLGGSGLNVSAVGLGTGIIGGEGWSAEDDEKSISAIQRAIDLGINLIDTAPIYGRGHSEVIVGRALRGRRQKAIIATKCGNNWDQSNINKVWRDSSRKRLLKEIDDSLRRLGVDVIDLWQVHWPDPNTPLRETMETMLKIKEQGKIRAIGVSNFSVQQIGQSMKYAPVVSDQPPYNILERDVEKEILPFCRSNNVGVIAYSATCKGILSGRYRTVGDEVPWYYAEDPDFKENFERNLRIVDALRPIASKYGRTPAQFAINWVINRPGVTAALMGSRTAARVEENAGAAGWKISPEDLEKVEKILDISSKKQ